MGKSAIREVLESINPFKKKKKKVNPMVADTQTVDFEALGLGGETIQAFRNATGAAITLGGKLVERRDAIVDQIDAKNYEQARQLLATFKGDIKACIAVQEDAALYVDTPAMTDEEREHARQLRLSIAEDIGAMKLDEAADEVEQLGAVCAGAQMRKDLGLDRVAQILRDEINAELPEDALPKEVKEVQALQALALKAMEGDLTAEKIEKARELAKPVYGAIEAIKRRQEITSADPTVLYERLKLRADDLLNYPEDYRSAAIRKLINGVDLARMDAQLKLADFSRAAKGSARDTAAQVAAPAISVLRQKIDAATPALRTHDAEVRKYFSTLKRITPQIKIADDLPEVDSGADTAWKAEREAYGASRDRLVALQDEHKFREANAELATCARLMKALLDKRRTSIDTDITGTANVGQARTLVTQLENAGLLAILTPEQQLALLRKIPPANATNKQSRYKVLAHPAMDETFVQAEAQVLKDVVKMLRGDDGKKSTPESRKAKQEWEENEKNWAAWAGKDPKNTGAKDLDKLQGIFQKIADAQFVELSKLSGVDPKALTEKLGKPLVTVEVVTLAPSVFGETTPDFPAKITINSAHRMFGDFKEMMDTILHENAHAWQNMIVAQYKAEGPFTAEDQAKVKGDTALPAMKVQAELFAENDASYTNTGEAYRHEPLEEQAWSFGGKSSQALLVPPPKRSFDSSKGLKNKFWVVASMSRSAGARVRLTERHGIYVDEWEGERAKDKKLTLEGVPGLSPTTRLVVDKVIDEYTLQLTYDASGLRGRMVSKTEVEQEMLALAGTQHPGKKLAELTQSERKDLFDDVLDQEDWEASGSEDDQTAVVRATDEVDVEHARLVLDEAVDKLS